MSEAPRLIVVPDEMPGWYLLEGKPLRQVVTFIEGDHVARAHPA